jgi:ABC-2 type transport system permease protein
MARRKGSPWTGAGAVFLKEFADHLGSARMFVLEWLVLLTGVGAVYTAIQDMRTTTAQDPFLFLDLFSRSHQPLPSFVGVLGFLIPLISIGLAFDSVNSEFNRRTMSRLLAQPIYRDAVLMGKFLGALATLAVGLAALWLLMMGLGLVTLGVPPTAEETLRGLAFLFVAIAYGALWIAVALLCSVIFRSTATSALVALGLWLLLTVLWPLLTRFLVQAKIHFQQTLARISPNRLFGEAMIGLLHPDTRTLGPVFLDQLVGAIIGTPLPFAQSLLLIWPQVTGLIAGTIFLFVIAYVLFQRQEVRA